MQQLLETVTAMQLH